VGTIHGRSKCVSPFVLCAKQVGWPVGRMPYHLSVYQHLCPCDWIDMTDLVQRAPELTLRLANGRCLDFSIMDTKGAIRSGGEACSKSDAHALLRFRSVWLRRFSRREAAENGSRRLGVTVLQRSMTCFV